jgi:hypothetical protein
MHYWFFLFISPIGTLIFGMKNYPNKSSVGFKLEYDICRRFSFRLKTVHLSLPENNRKRKKLIQQSNKVTNGISCIIVSGITAYQAPPKWPRVFLVSLDQGLRHTKPHPSDEGISCIIGSGITAYQAPPKWRGYFLYHWIGDYGIPNPMQVTEGISCIIGSGITAYQTPPKWPRVFLVSLDRWLQHTKPHPPLNSNHVDFFEYLSIVIQGDLGCVTSLLSSITRQTRCHVVLCGVGITRLVQGSKSLTQSKHFGPLIYWVPLANESWPLLQSRELPYTVCTDCWPAETGEVDQVNKSVGQVHLYYISVSRFL